MNIRMCSGEIKFRLEQAEIAKLLTDGLLEENIFLPEDNLLFTIEFADQVAIISRKNHIIFKITEEEKVKLLSSESFKEPIICIDSLDDYGKKVTFKVEVDAFNTLLRGRRK